MEINIENLKQQIKSISIVEQSGSYGLGWKLGSDNMRQLILNILDDLNKRDIESRFIK